MRVSITLIDASSTSKMLGAGSSTEAQRANWAEPEFHEQACALDPLNCLPITLNPVAPFRQSAWRQYGLEVLPGNDLMVEINRDDNVGSHSARHANRHRVDKASINQDPAVTSYWCEDTGYGNAGTHGINDIAAGYGEFLAANNVGGHGGKPFWQLLYARGLHVLTHQIADLGTVQQPGLGQHNIEKATVFFQSKD